MQSDDSARPTLEGHFSKTGAPQQLRQFRGVRDTGHGILQLPVGRRVSRYEPANFWQHPTKIKSEQPAKESALRLCKFKNGQRSARPQNTPQLRNSSRIVGKIAKTESSGYQIEALRSKRQMECIGFEKFNRSLAPACGGFLTGTD